MQPSFETGCLAALPVRLSQNDLAFGWHICPVDIEDARHPHKYRMLVQMVDCIFADVAQPDQTRIVAINAHNFLKNEGNFDGLQSRWQWLSRSVR